MTRTERLTVSASPDERCPYCGAVDPEPRTHLSAGRCHPPARKPAGALLLEQRGYVPPWWTRLAPGKCHAGRSGGWASFRGTKPCRFRALWRVTTRGGTYELCGTHLRAAEREVGGPDWRTKRPGSLTIEWIGPQR